MGKAGFAINQLLTRSLIPTVIKKKKVVLKPEELLSVQFADELCKLTVEFERTGKGLRAVWTHCANERVAGWFTMILLRAMGMLKGSLDYWFVWDGGGGMIELKVDGELTKEQQYFFTWAHSVKANRAMHRSVEGALKSLKEWGAIV